MRKALIWFCALLLAALPARAVTVIQSTGEDVAARLEQAREAVRDLEVGRYGMTPIGGGCVPDGAYPVKVESSSAFFKIVDATLTVSGGDMALAFLIGSESYDAVYPGAAADAVSGKTIPGEIVSGGTRFAVPVPALNAPFECAAHSVNRDMWYDRLLLVNAASLPAGTLAFDLPDYELIERALRGWGGPAGHEPQSAVEDIAPAEPVTMDLADGQYAIEVNLAGGSGRASVSSPTKLIIRDGRAYARLLWSSSYYDYMLLGGERYENLSAGDGNSTFEIPITALDAPMDVVADTTAMGDPVEIQYQLTFYAESVGDVGQVPQEAARQVLIISLSIIIVGGVLNWLLKRRRAR